MSVVLTAKHSHICLATEVECQMKTLLNQHPIAGWLWCDLWMPESVCRASYRQRADEQQWGKKRLKGRGMTRTQERGFNWWTSCFRRQSDRFRQSDTLFSVWQRRQREKEAMNHGRWKLVLIFQPTKDTIVPQTVIDADQVVYFLNVWIYQERDWRHKHMILGIYLQVRHQTSNTISLYSHKHYLTLKHIDS